MPSRSSAFELSLTIALPRNFLAGFKAPKTSFSIPVAKLLSYFVPALKPARKFLGKAMVKDSSKAEDLLGIKYRDVSESILEDAKSLTEFNKI